MSDDWKPGSATVPTRPMLTPEEQEFVLKALRGAGFENDIFSMHPRVRAEMLQASKFFAAAVYAAIKEATKGHYVMTQSFTSWAREMGCQW